jgi:hypothetical protein
MKASSKATKQQLGGWQKVPENEGEHQGVKVSSEV